MHPSYVSVHPVALAMAAAQGVRTHEAGNVVTADLHDSGGAIIEIVVDYSQDDIAAAEM